jgi:hypothetical protein
MSRSDRRNSPTLSWDGSCNPTRVPPLGFDGRGQPHPCATAGVTAHAVCHRWG